MRMKMNLKVVSLGVLTLVASCGGSGGGSKSEEGSLAENEVATITYRAVLNPLNNSGAHGTVVITRDADQLEVEISVAGAPSSVHAQNIHSGTACPTEANAGEDKIVDANEALAVMGQSIIPLDSDLSSKESGGIFPAGNSYRYSEATSWDLMTGELQPGLNLEGKVIHVQGGSGAADLPVACGVLVEVPSEET